MNTTAKIVNALGPCRKPGIVTDHYTGRKAAADIVVGDVVATRTRHLNAVGAWGVVESVETTRRKGTHRPVVVITVRRADDDTVVLPHAPGVLLRVADGSHNEVSSAYCELDDA